MLSNMCLHARPSRLLLPAHDALLPGEDGGLRAVEHMELAENITDVPFHRFLADNQFLSNLCVGAPGGDEAQYLAFALTQVSLREMRLTLHALDLLHNTQRDTGMQ